VTPLGQDPPRNPAGGELTPPTPFVPPRSKAMRKLKIVVISIVALLVLIVVLQNTQTIETRILFASLRMPLAALLFGTLMIGLALGVLTAVGIVRWRGK
jgi:uncharacterized integral membrane protein